MNLPAFATCLGCADGDVLLWLRELRLTEPCARCNGTGFYDAFEKIVCFKCMGHGDQLPKLTLVLAREVAARVVRGGLRSYFRRKRQAKALST